MRSFRCFLGMLCLFAAQTALQAQTATGIYPFGSFDAKGFDVINRGNLNTHFNIPIINKPGRGGQDFSYNLVYDSLFWQPTTVGNTTVWSPGNFGWQADQTAPVTGYLSYSTWSGYCEYDGSLAGYGYYVTYYGSFVYYSPDGAAHSYAGYLGGCDYDSPGLSPSSDGSVVDNTNAVTLPNGKTVTVGSSADNPGVADSNGNQVTWASGTFTDTTGHPVLSISDSGYTYPTLNGIGGAGTNYQQYTVQTSFNCPGILDYGPQTVSLISSINLSDGSSYQFTYEGNGSTTTGRLASITLPTGGVIQYQYQGGVACSGSIPPVGSPTSLTRTVDGASTSYESNGSNLIIVTHPMTPGQSAATEEFLTFTTWQNAPYETRRMIFNNGVSPHPQYDLSTCYNGAAMPCDVQSLSNAVTQTSTYERFDDSLRGVDTAFDDQSNVTSIAWLGYGRSATLKKQVYDYATFGDGTGNTFEKLRSVITKDGSDNIISSETYGYDENGLVTTSGLPNHVSATGQRANLTSITSTVNPPTSPGMITRLTYDDAGSVRSSTSQPSVGGATWTTGFGYDSTDTYQTLTNYPTPTSGVALSTSVNTDVLSGLPVSSTGMNGAVTEVASYDTLRRPTQINNPGGQGWTKISYPSPNQVSTSALIDATTNTQSDTETKLDGYGRVVRTATQSSPGIWFQADTCYDGEGRVTFQSITYQGGGLSDPPSTCTGAGVQYQYDGLGRLVKSISPDGTSSYSYFDRAVQSQDVNGVQHVTQTDALDRISAVCEATPSGTQMANGETAQTIRSLDLPCTGFLTSYSYGTFMPTVTVTQGAQTRTFATDTTGALIQSTEPERGTTAYSYSYNASGRVSVRERARENQTNPNVKTHTTTQYDTIGRVVSISYDNGQPTKTFSYDVVPGGFSTAPFSVGQLSSASDGSATSNYIYDSMGRVTGTNQCVPGYCNVSPYTIYYSYYYDQAGNKIQENYPVAGSFGPGATTASTVYTYDNAGAVTSISNSQGGTVVGQSQPGPHGPSSYTLPGNHIVASTYDTLGRENQRAMCSTSVDPTCANPFDAVYAWQATYKGNRLIQGADLYTYQYVYPSYDSLNRMTSANYVSGAEHSVSWTYDRYGNRWSQSLAGNVSGAQPSYSFDVYTNHLNGAVYDAAGNMTTGPNGELYAYDADGNLTASTANGVSTSSYYDALNQRVRYQTSAGTTTYYTYNASGQRFSSYDASANLLGVQIYWGNSPVAIAKGNGSLEFPMMDYVGSKRMMQNFVAQPTSAFNWLPFGDSYHADSGPDDDPQHFAGLDGDADGTHHAQFRNYSPLTAQWLSPDPYSGSYVGTDPQSLNRYAYVENMPMSLTDPTGLVKLNQTYYDQLAADRQMFELWFQLMFGGGFQAMMQPAGVGGGGAAAPAPNNVTCAGKTTMVSGNIRIQANAAGVITAVGIPLTGASGYQTTTDYGVNIQIQPSTIVGVGLNPSGSLSVGVNNPIYVSSAGSFFGGYVSSLTFSNGAFTQVNGSISFLGIHGSTSTPSSRLASILNSNSGLTNAAQLLQSAAQLAQSIVGCKVGG